MNFNEEKTLLKKALQHKKEEVLNELNDIEKEIEKINDPIDLYMQFVEIYGNTLEQAKYNIVFIKKIFKDEFYQFATTKIHPNHIEFFNQHLSICFPTSRCRRIIISTKLEKPKKPIEYSESYMREYSLGKQYLDTLNRKTLKEYVVTKRFNLFKSRVRYYDNLTFIEKLQLNKSLKYYTLKSIEDDVFEQEIAIKESQKIKLEYEKNIKQYNEIIEQIENLINNMPSLKLLNEKDWHFEFVEITPPTWVKNTSKKW